MRTLIDCSVQAFDDPDKKNTLFGPDRDNVQITVDGFLRESTGRFRISQGDPAFNVPLGNVASPKLVHIRAIGVAGLNMLINGQLSRSLRPINPNADVPTALYMETCTDFATMTLTHPGPSTAAPVEGWYLIEGDTAT